MAYLQYNVDLSFIYLTDRWLPTDVSQSTFENETMKMLHSRWLHTGLCVWKGGLHFLSLCLSLWMLNIEVELSRQLFCTVTLSAHIPKWAFLWQVIYPRTKFNHKDSPGVVLTAETASLWVHQLVLGLPPAAASLSAATTGATGTSDLRDTPQWVN